MTDPTRTLIDAVRTWYGGPAHHTVPLHPLAIAWEEYANAAGICEFCGRPRCPECKVCPLCAGDGHDEGCSRQGDEYHPTGYATPDPQES